MSIRRLSILLLTSLLLCCILLTRNPAVCATASEDTEEEGIDPYADSSLGDYDGGFELDSESLMPGYGEYEGIGPGEDFGDYEDKYGVGEEEGGHWAEEGEMGYEGDDGDSGNLWGEDGEYLGQGADEDYDKETIEGGWGEGGAEVGGPGLMTAAAERLR